MPRSPATDTPALPRPARAYARQVRLGPMEWVGIPLLALLPLLALAGLLGPSTSVRMARVSTATSELSVELAYPSRLRYTVDGDLVLRITNTGPGEVSELAVVLDEAYLERFGRVQSLPQAQSIGSGGLRVALPLLRAGESTGVRVTLQADEWGRLPGWVELGVDQSPARARLNFSTLVLP